MKKLLLVFMAAILAIGFSAFSPQALTGVYYYPSSTSSLMPTIQIPCPDGPIFNCIAPIPELGNAPRQLFKENGDPYSRPEDE